MLNRLVLNNVVYHTNMREGFQKITQDAWYNYRALHRNSKRVSLIFKNTMSEIPTYNEVIGILLVMDKFYMRISLYRYNIGDRQFSRVDLIVSKRRIEICWTKNYILWYFIQIFFKASISRVLVYETWWIISLWSLLFLREKLDHTNNSPKFDNYMHTD